MDKLAVSTAVAATAVEIGTLVCTDVLILNTTAGSGKPADQEAIRRGLAVSFLRHVQQSK